MRKFLVDYDAGVSDEVLQDQRFEFRPRVILEKAPRGPDSLIMQFTNANDMTEEELTALDVFAKRGIAVVVEKNRPVANADKFKPSQVVEFVYSQIPFRFSMSDHTNAWQAQAIRPKGDDSAPERTIEQFCVYDRPHKDYLYTQAWINRLIEKCSTEDGFTAFTGRPPKRK